MSFAIKILGRAQADIEDSYSWLHVQSPSGASAWYAALWLKLGELSESAANFSTAPEAASLNIDLRQAFFRTRRGRTYRLVYILSGETVKILRVRGPGQRPVRRGDVSLDG